MKFNSILFCLFFTLYAGSFNTAKAQAFNVSDSLALVDLYNSTDGLHWVRNTNWLAGPVNTWLGIGVTGTRVTSIYLPFNGLSGTLPASIGNLDKLYELYLSSNSISGPIPVSFGNLASLVKVEILFNQLSGAIPSAIGNLTMLESMDLSVNQLSGSIPSAIGNLTRLQKLRLNQNQLSGVIPASIGNLINLTDLQCFNGRLTGAIPSAVGNLTKLQYLSFDNNDLSGVIPSSFSNLTNLIQLGLSGNRLSGQLPAYLNNFPNLSAVFLDNNQLSGSIPSSYSKLKTMYLYLSHNQLVQRRNLDLPMSQVTNAVADISYNRFTFNGLEVLAVKRPYVTYAPQAPLNIHLQGNTLSVYAGGTLSNNTYIWFRAGKKDSTVISGDSTFTPAQNGRYYAKIANATATRLTLYTDTITYIAPLAAAFSPATAFQVYKTSNSLLVYPNPAKDIVHVNVNGNATLFITNAAGKIVLSKSIAGNEEINVSRFANGLYYIQNKATGEVRKIAVVH